MNTGENSNIKKPIIIFIAFLVVLFFGYFLFQSPAWEGDKQIHTLMEAIATLLVVIVGTLAMVHFYTKTMRKVAEGKKVEKQLWTRAEVLNGINEVFRERIKCKTEEELGRTCLAVAERLSGSRFGFLGELNSEGLFDTIAISNPGWDACKIPEGKATLVIKNMRVAGIDRSAMIEGKSRIVNGEEALVSHPDRLGTPEGHPKITALLSVPLKKDGKIIGMISLGNKEGGYSLEDKNNIEALSAAIVEALESKRVENALEAAETNLRNIINSNSDGIIIVDKDGIIRFVNPSAEFIFGRKAEELLGKRFESDVTAGRKTELEFVQRSGRKIIAEMQAVETQWEGKNVCLASLRDITELVQLREELRAMSLTDELTGLYNRRGFLALTQQQLKLAKRTNNGLFLFFCDLDGLKLINDTLGHNEGDMALTDIARILKESFRESDIIARIGGDEFAVLVINGTNGNEENITSNLKKNMEAFNLNGNYRYKLSLSWGMSQYNPESPCSVEELITRADNLMYKKKRMKRRVFFRQGAEI